MPATFQYRWEYLAPNETSSVFLHGWRGNEFLVYSIRPRPLPLPGGDDYGWRPASASLRQPEVVWHVNQTYGRTAEVTNLTGTGIMVDLDAFTETVEF